MRKFLVLLLMLFFANVAFAVNSYDRYGQKQAHLKRALIRKLPLDIISMTKIAKRLEIIKRHLQDIIPMINMVKRLLVTKQILMA